MMHPVRKAASDFDALRYLSYPLMSINQLIADGCCNASEQASK